MRIFKFFIPGFLGFILLALPHSSMAAKGQDAQTQENKKQPIEIQSDKLRSENEGGKIIFSGNVVSTWGDLEIKSDVLEVYAQPKTRSKKRKKEIGDQPEQDIDKIIAIGNVRIKKGDRRAKGDRAYYDNKTQKITITGEPHATAWEGDNIIKGGKMIFFLEKDLFEVKERVSLKLFPKNPPPEPK